MSRPYSLPERPKLSKAQQRLGREAVLRLILAAYLLHFGEEWRQPGFAGVMLALNVAQLFTGRIVPLFLAGAAVFLSYFVTSFPGVANHVTVGAIATVLVLLALLRESRGIRKPNSFFADVTLLAAVVYLCAGFHKLNADFFDPAVSCANWYGARLLRIWWDSGAPSVPGALAPEAWAIAPAYLAAGMELAGGLGLLWWRKRQIGPSRSARP